MSPPSTLETDEARGFSQSFDHVSPLSNIERVPTVVRPSGDGDLTIHPVLAAGLGGALLLHLGILLSLPPVIMGKGAPFLPTSRRGLDAMFRHVRRQPAIVRKIAAGTPLRFVDLGSGDGRVVFRAAREKMFGMSVGVEVNPLLHVWASCWRALVPGYWSETQLVLRDLWKVDLSNADVVAIYGLQPIMKDLGIKMKAELRPGVLVVSNVFSIPGWRTSVASQDGVHLYRVPECWEPRKDAKLTDTALRE